MKTKLLESQLNKATSELLSLNTKYMAAQKEIGHLKTANAELETKNLELETRLAALEAKKNEPSS